MKNLTVKEFNRELQKSGTTIKDLLLNNLDYVECELEEGGSYLGYSILLSVVESSPRLKAGDSRFG